MIILLFVSVNSLAQRKAVVYGNHLSLEGDYLIPDLKLSDTTEYHIGKYGRMRQRFLNETEKPPQPKPSILAEKYPRLKEIDDKLKDQNKATFEREKRRNKLKKEMSECVGIFKGSRRKELQQEIDSVDNQISNMKKRLSSIMWEYKFDSVQAFYKEFSAARKDYFDYQMAHAEWEKTCGDKAEDSMSIRDRLRQKERIVKANRASGKTERQSKIAVLIAALSKKD